MGLGGGSRPFWIALARNLPIRPLLFKFLVEGLAQRFHLRLPLLVDDVDLSVIGDSLQRDMGHPLVDEAQPDGAVDWLRRLGHGREFCLLLLPVPGVGQQVVGVTSAHDSCAGES